jgi:uncharacterized protein (DUF169 family)
MSYGKKNMDYTFLAGRFSDLLSLKYPPVAISFQATAPSMINRIDVPAPSGCVYWRLAAEGKTFYTTAPDHYECAIGAYINNVDLPPDKVTDLEVMVKEMVNLQYISNEEVGNLPRMVNSFGVAIYSPLSDTAFDPDIILLRGNAKQIMLMAEAARATNLSDGGGVMGRPACSMIPAVLKSARFTISLGCIGNRVYTMLGDDELYCSLPSEGIDEVLKQLEITVSANRRLEMFHMQRST